MNLDLISTYGQTTFNVKLAHIIGLKPAIYWSVVTDLLYQAKKKDKVSEEGCFVIDRKYIFEQTTLTTPEQKECEKILEELGYLVSGDKANSISIDVGGITELIIKDDPEQIDFTKEQVSRIVKVDKEANKVEAMNRNLKARLKETDFEILNALYGWVDSLEGKANTKTVEIFESELNKYTKDKQVKLELIKLATINGYRNLTWVINSYERSKGQPTPQVSTASKQVGKPVNVAKDISEINVKRIF